MSVEYRIIDAEETSKDVVQTFALESLTNSYRAECELERLEAIWDLLSEEDREHLTESLAKAKESADTLRAQATRNIGAAGVSAEAQKDAIAEVLTEWLTNVEKEHAGVASLISFRAKMLELPRKHKGYVKKADRAGLEEELGLLRGQLTALGIVWNIATTRLDAL